MGYQRHPEGPSSPGAGILEGTSRQYMGDGEGEKVHAARALGAR